MQKYLRVPSLVKDKYLFPRNNKGISPKNLNSTPTQTTNQFLAEMVTKGPKNNTNINKTFADDKSSDWQSCSLTSITSVLPATTQLLLVSFI